MLVAGIFVLIAGLVRADEASFSQSISPEDFKAAGLERLTPGERQHLDEMVAAYKKGLVVAAQQTAEEALKAKQQAEAESKAAKEETKAAKQETVAAKAETRAAKAEVVESKGGNQGFFSKAKVKVVPGTKIEYAEITSTIKGDFEGWSGRTVFVLENGQRWQVANSDERYFTPTVRNVPVAIRPAALGGFWMYFPSLNDLRVRVKLLGGK